MRYLNGWHPLESIRFDSAKITMWRCLVLQIWEQQKQLLRIFKTKGNPIKYKYCWLFGFLLISRHGTTLQIECIFEVNQEIITSGILFTV